MKKLITGLEIARALQAKQLAALVKAGVRVGLISKNEEDAKVMTDKIKAELEAE